MKIGILGAPGSGKTKFARALARLLADDDTTATVVDNYVQEIQKKSGLALGPWTDYSEELMIAGVREAKRSMKPGDYQISVGTVMDTMNYVMVHNDIVMHAHSRAELVDVYREAQTIVHALSLWYTSTWDYDVCFLLPLNAPTGTDPVSSFNAMLSEAYPVVIETFYVPNVFSLEGDAKERADIALQVIRTLEQDQSASEFEESISATETEPSEDQERSVRPGGEAGKGIGDSTQPVSDVS